MQIDFDDIISVFAMGTVVAEGLAHNDNQVHIPHNVYRTGSWRINQSTIL